MKTTIKRHLPGYPARATWHLHAPPAFTLIELLVVIATLAVLSAMLLPALAGTRAQPKTTACAANFRQWTVSVNLYANDHLDWLPRFDWNGGGGSYLWDVSTNFIPGLAPYGLTVPMWFCPVRPNEFDDAQKGYGKPIVTIQDLQATFGSGPFIEVILRHNWWGQRSGVIPASSGSLFPPDSNSNPLFLALNSWARGTPLGLYGAPRKLHDNAAAHVPFISDKAGSSLHSSQGFAMPQSGKASTSPNDCSPNTAHFVNGVLLGVNAAYADGHVEPHSKVQMNCGYSQGDPYWFY
ncbi:MAG TPA: type II secretion system protein [Candidatus Acidoferrum sp.]|nr:type II secretion system protein [Candidatus Acidoferrum sp.]